MSNSIAVAVEKVRESLVHRRVKAAALGVGSVVLMDVDEELGAASCAIRIETGWRIDATDRAIVGSEDERAKLKAALLGLTGCVIEAVEVTVPAFDLRLSFSNGQLLCAFSLHIDSDAYENWTVLGLDGLAVVSGPGCQLRSLPRNR